MDATTEFGVGAIFSLIGESLNEVEADLKKMDFFELEKHTELVVKEFGRRYLQLISNLRIKSEPASRKKIKCIECKKTITVHKSSAPRKLSCLYGEIEVRSDYYYCRDCKGGFRPFDGKLHLKNRANESPLLEEKVCLFGKDYPFEKASEMLNRILNIQISDNKVRIITEEKGSEVLRHQENLVDEYKARPQTQREISASNDSIETLYLQVDGSHVPMQKEFREAKLVISFEQKDRYTPSKDRPLLLNKNYSGKVAYIDEFKKYFEYHVRTYGVNQAKKLVVLADGADWIWNLAEEYLPSDRLEILDYYHASEYIWNFSQAVHGDEKQAEQLAKHLEGLLLEKTPGDAIRAIEETKVTTEDGKQARKTILRYFNSHKHRMKYAEYRAENFIIGSGAIEGGNKNVVHQRCRQSGMHWSVDGANALIGLRCWFESGRWDELGWGNQQLALAA